MWTLNDVLSRSTPFFSKGYGSTQEVIDSPHCRSQPVCCLNSPNVVRRCAGKQEEIEMVLSFMCIAARNFRLVRSRFFFRTKKSYRATRSTIYSPFAIAPTVKKCNFQLYIRHVWYGTKSRFNSQILRTFTHFCNNAMG